MSADADREWANTWYAQRRGTLELFGLWEYYGQVPRAERRTKPLAEYLPGGSEYDE